jgi:hypothetical protein
VLDVTEKALTTFSKLPFIDPDERTQTRSSSSDRSNSNIHALFPDIIDSFPRPEAFKCWHSSRVFTAYDNVSSEPLRSRTEWMSLSNRITAL